jgi:hypothetical protein
MITPIYSTEVVESQKNARYARRYFGPISFGIYGDRRWAARLLTTTARAVGPCHGAIARRTNTAAAAPPSRRPRHPAA